MHTSAELRCLYRLTRQRVEYSCKLGACFRMPMATVMKMASLMLRLGLQLLKRSFTSK